MIFFNCGCCHYTFKFYSYRTKDCQIIHSRLRDPHKAVYSMTMIGVVQEAQFSKFVNLARNLSEATHQTQAEEMQEKYANFQPSKN